MCPHHDLPCVGSHLFGHLAISRAMIGPNGPVPGSGVGLTRIHLRMLLPQAGPEIADLDNLAVQLTTALEGLLLLALYAAARDCQALRFAGR
jgi:hypothetical protein